ncbi:MAG: BatA protein [Candidatus Hydrogenedentota bacterium]
MTISPLVGSHALMHPAFLLLLVPVAVLLAFEWFAKAPGAVTVSTGQILSRIHKGRRTGLRRLPVLLRALGLAALVVALARPLHGLAPQKDEANIIDIMLCLDVSGSMRVMDFVNAGDRMTRLDVAKVAVHQFIDQRKAYPKDRFGLDRLGLILYSRYAWTQTPLTLDYEILSRDLLNAEIDLNRNKQGTAIGSAIGLAVSKLRGSEAKTKVAVLLTDGRNNAGELDPITAAQIAKEYNIRVYTIGAGSSDAVFVPGQDGFGGFLGHTTMTTLPIDEDMLKKIAETTGGRYFRATDMASLEGAYREINELETTKVELGDYYEYQEGFVPWAVFGGLAMMASILTRRMWFESVP